MYGPLESLPARGAWVETLSGWVYTMVVESLPARGAWVETRLVASNQTLMQQVAPRKGSVG